MTKARCTMAAVALLAGGCHFNVRGADTALGGGGDDLGVVGDDLGAVDLAGADLVGVAPVCTPSATSCSGSNLVTCNADGSASTATACTLGCSMSGAAHCQLFFPRAPLTRGDFDPSGLVAQSYNMMGQPFGTDSGQIGSGANPVRVANTDPTQYEVHQGVGFHTVDIPNTTTKLAVWTFSSLSVNKGATLTLYGSNAAALVSASSITLNGTIDATCAGNVFISSGSMLYLAGPGGNAGAAPGGATGSPVMGGGVSGDGAHAAGGGGGGYADVGGSGGADNGNSGAAGGVAVGSPTLSPLVGGSGGGAGGPNPASDGAPGGGGGGVVVLVAQSIITVGGNGAAGGVNAGGCGGSAQTGAVLSSLGGGGGGSGGSIWLQSPTVHLMATGVLAANGGGGAAGGTLITGSSQGKSGLLGGGGAAGGVGSVNDGSGGSGGAAASTLGQPGGNGASSGGGGGGAVGRIRLESRSGSATLDSGAIVSPGGAQATIDVH